MPQVVYSLGVINRLVRLNYSRLVRMSPLRSGNTRTVLTERITRRRADCAGGPVMFSDAPDHPGYVPQVVTCSQCARTMTILVPRWMQDIPVEGWQCEQCKKVEERNKRIDDAFRGMGRGDIPESVADRILRDLRSLRTETT